jgi:hypothetical protein
MMVKMTFLPLADRDIAQDLLRRAAHMMWAVLLSATLHLRRAFRAVGLSVLWLVENAMAVAGYEACVAMLVLQAVMSLNAFSFAYMAAAGAGMFWKQRISAALTRVLGPLLLGLALAQYALLLRMPAALWPEGVLPMEGGNSAVRGWLGLAPTTSEAAVLLATSGLVTMQAHCVRWRAYVSQPQHSTAAGLHTVHACVAEMPHQADTVVLLSERGPTVVPIRSAVESAAPYLRPAIDWGLGRPMSLERRSTWGWPAWFRFWLFRLSLDTLMVIVVALCCVQRDLIHAGYLGLTLLLFRRREALRVQGNELFVWMPLANFGMIVTLLVFQAPWAWDRARDELGEDGASMHDEPPQRGVECTIAGLLGLHRIGHGGEWAALSLAPHGAGIPLLLWVAIQVCGCACVCSRACLRHSVAARQLHVF